MRFAVACLALAGTMAAQDRPVIDPRGITDAFTRAPAPVHAGLGALLRITGLNLGPPEGAAASGAPWPTQLGGVQVFINGKAAPLGSVAPGLILAQAPPDAGAGLAEVVVVRAGARSAPARVYLDTLRPAVKTVNGSGAGQPWGTLDGSTLTLSAAGLGPADPGSPPKPAISAFVGGLAANAAATASAERPGEFDVRIEIPAGARPGDPITLLADRQSANQTVFQSLQAPQAAFLPLPPGTPELRVLTAAGLDGSFLIGTGARGDDGCYPAALFDFRAARAAPIGGCLTAGNKNAASPLAVSTNGNSLAALVGPPQGEAPAGVSSQLQIFSSAAGPLTVNLPAAASLLAATAAGDFAAILPGNTPPAVVIDGQTGEVLQGADAGPGGVAGAGGGGLGAALAGTLAISVDGLTHPLSVPVQMAQGRIALVVGDDPNAPQHAKFAVVNLASGDVVLSRDFPAGWLPLLGAAPPTPPAAGSAALLAARAGVSYDAARQTFYALVRNADNSRQGFAAFKVAPRDTTAAQAIPFPDGWFAAACTASLRIFTFELSRRVALAASTVPETQFKTACAGLGFLQLDLETQAVSAVPLPGQAQLNVSGANEINDYIYATNIDPSRRGQSADTVFLLDGVTGAAFTLTLPSGINGFASLRPVPELSVLIGEATNQTAGDQGLLLFDLDQATARVLPVPDGFDRVVELNPGVFLTTRKLAAQALQAKGSQFVIYDLASGEMNVIANPEGVASVGPLPQTGTNQGGGFPGPGTGPGPPTGPLPGVGGTPAVAAARLAAANPTANTFAAVTYDAGGRQTGVLVVRVP